MASIKKGKCHPDVIQHTGLVAELTCKNICAMNKNISIFGE